MNNSMPILNDIKIFFNSQDERYKSKFGAVPCDSSIIFNVDIISSQLIKEIVFCTYLDNTSKPYEPHKKVFPMKKAMTSKDTYKFSYEYQIKSSPGLIFYYFKIIFFDNTYIFYGNNKEEMGGIGEIYDMSPKPYQLTTYYRDNHVPSWFKSSIIYQIFPDRFFNGNEDNKLSAIKKNTFIYGNWYDKPMYIKDPQGEILRWDFYGGNLKGITKKIDYMKDLGINLIYLNPIFEAASNHRYDTGNYENIDPILGSEEDFDSLISSLEKNNMNLILDGVFNHTGRNSKYFNYFSIYDSIGAYNSKASPYYSWYQFKNYPNEYESWWGIEDLPNINELEPSFMDYIIKNEDSIVNKWMKKGIKGWRLDVADELPGGFLKELKTRVRELNPQSILLGEVWEDASNKISYDHRREYFIGNELDSVTNYIFRNTFLDFFSGKIDSKKVNQIFMKLMENYPLENFYSLANIISSHDIERIRTSIKNIINDLFSHDKLLSEKNNSFKDTDIKFLKLISLVQMTFPGVPLIYYGDEVGLEGGTDPDNRRTYPWGEENLEILHWYKDIIKMRLTNPLLSTGYFKEIYVNDDVYGYIRYLDDGYNVFNEKVESDNFIIVLINRNINNLSYLEINLEDFKDINSFYKAKTIYEINLGEINLSSSKILNLKIDALGYLILSNKELKFKK